MHTSPALFFSGSLRTRSRLLPVCLCFFLSGIAALIYQIAWTRQFALVFGTTEVALAAVLAAYMGGLALGAWWTRRLMPRVHSPLLWYARLEAGIAIGALLVPLLLLLTSRLLVALAGGNDTLPDASSGATAWFYVVAAFVVLAVPTVCMGATLPLLARYAVRDEAQIGRHVGALYACNTAGAVAGALLASLWLLPAAGLSRTVWVGAAINAVVAVIAFALFMRDPHATPPAARATGMAMHGGLWVLPLMLLSGVVSFTHEVLWTRLLSHVLGSSLYAFGVMLASFLAGIALGGACGAWLAHRRHSAARWLVISQWGTAIAAAGAWIVVTRSDLAFASMADRLGFGLALLLPLSFAIGSTYPLAVRVLAANVDDAAAASARVYGWNTMGAIAGSLAAAFLVLPALRYEGTLKWAVVASLFLAAIAAGAVWKVHPLRWSSAAALAVLVLLLYTPVIPESLLRHSPLRISPQGELLYYGVGRSAAVIALGDQQQIALRANGLPEAALDVRGGAATRAVEDWLLPLGVAARPAARELLMVGLGGARALELAPQTLSVLDVIELEPRIIEANRQLSGLRRADPLTDPRVRLIVNDARHALLLSTRRYDVIVSQPSHPWTAGASHLYTREFMRLCREHLQRDGVLVQWMNIEFLNDELLRSLLATLLDVFPEVRVYRPTPMALLLLASPEPITPESQAVRTAALPATTLSGFEAAEDLLAALVLDTSGARALAGTAAPITDDRNRFATTSVYDRPAQLDATRLSAMLAPHDALLAMATMTVPAGERQPAWDYIARRVAASGGVDGGVRDRLQRLAARHADTPLEVYIKALIVADAGQSAQAEEVLAIGTTLFPGDPLLRSALLAARSERLSAAELELAARSGGLDAATVLMLNAQRAAVSSDWSALSRMDDGLSRVAVTSVWYRQSQQLRSRWRAQLPAAESRRG